jgi:hypothetical protein
LSPISGRYRYSLPNLTITLDFASYVGGRKKVPTVAVTTMTKKTTRILVWCLKRMARKSLTVPACIPAFCLSSIMKNLLRGCGIGIGKPTGGHVVDHQFPMN